MGNHEVTNTEPCEEKSRLLANVSQYQRYSPTTYSPFHLDSSLIYDVQFSGWFQWNGGLKNNNWNFVFNVSNSCEASGTGEKILFGPDKKEYKLTRFISGYFGDGKVDLLVNYSDGSIGTFIGHYCRSETNNDIYTIELNVIMTKLGDLGKLHFYPNGKGGGICTIYPSYSNLVSPDESVIQRFFSICNFNVINCITKKLTVPEMRTLRLVSSWFKLAISSNFIQK